MSGHPVFDAAEHAVFAAAREWATVEEHVASVLHHHETPAQQPATMKAATAAAQQEDTMSLATLEEDVKTDLTQGLDWLEGFVGRVKSAAPGIIATSEAVGGSTVGALAEMFLGKILPPEIETELLTVVHRYVSTFGQPAVASEAPAAPPAQ